MVGFIEMRKMLESDFFLKKLLLRSRELSCLFGFGTITEEEIVTLEE